MTKRKSYNNDNAYNNKKSKQLTANKNPLMFTPKLELVLTTLMALTGLIYCIAALEESAQAGKEVAATLETIFFTTTAVSYFVIAAWMCRIKNRFNGGLPYTISIAGSAALIATQFPNSRTTRRHWFH